MLTVEAAARRACVTETVIRAWIETGRLRYAVVEGVPLVSSEDLDGVLAAFKL